MKKMLRFRARGKRPTAVPCERGGVRLLMVEDDDTPNSYAVAVPAEDVVLIHEAQYDDGTPCAVIMLAGEQDPEDDSDRDWDVCEPSFEDLVAQWEYAMMGLPVISGVNYIGPSFGTPASTKNAPSPWTVENTDGDVK